jgi:Cu(I)/Ag(I) efflux system membrane fusion protein
LYSPELLATQQELIESVKMMNSLQNGETSYLFDMANQQLNSIRERLRLWGLTKEQIAQMEKNLQPSDRITIYSPTSGIVVERNALEGTYVNTGTKIYTIADLSKVWMKMDAYESDLPWLKYGQEVEFRTEAYPDQIFNGWIAFIEPTLHPTTRTVKIRVNVDNRNGRLKPEMLVHAIVRSQITQAGKVMDPNLAGKWISPMHPEVIKDRPGKCDVCGMPLVRAETLGYVSANELRETPLVVPASAPLITGKRAVVYVELPGKPGTYEGREIELGAKAGDYYLVKSGLEVGERVVVKGNFKIDSAIQIQAKPSMMNPEGGALATGHQHGTQGKQQETDQPEEHQSESAPEKFAAPQAFKKQLASVYAAYFDLQYSLSHDQFDPVKAQAGKLLDALKTVDMKLLKGDIHNTWMKQLKNIQQTGYDVKSAKDIENARKDFDKLSQTLIEVAKTFGSDNSPLLVYHCPMAFDYRGADWLQNKEGTENPYFGSAMFSCGNQTADLTSSAAKEKQGEHQHE